MVKQLEDVVNSIGDLLEDGQKEPSREIAEKYGGLFAEMLYDRIKPREVKEKGTLRISNIGQPCERKLWYDIHYPNDGEKLKAHTKLKFLYGDVTELLMLYLAEASGHRVEGTQDTQVLAGATGHRDCLIDGVTVDVKSAAPFSYKKFEDNTLEQNDAFGYIPQINGYRVAAKDDPLVTDKNRSAFLAFDKVSGHFCLDIHEDDGKDYEQIFEQKKQMVDQPEPPERAYTDIPEGKSGNLKLGVGCSYCSHKKRCWPEVRGFAYSSGPTFLTKVERVPNVPEFEVI